MRRGPGPDSAAFAMLPKGTRGHGRDGWSAAGRWSSLENGEQGYINAAFLDLPAGIEVVALETAAAGLDAAAYTVGAADRYGGGRAPSTTPEARAEIGRARRPRARAGTAARSPGGAGVGGCVHARYATPARRPARAVRPPAASRCRGRRRRADAPCGGALLPTVAPLAGVAGDRTVAVRSAGVGLRSRISVSAARLRATAGAQASVASRASSRVANCLLREHCPAVEQTAKTIVGSFVCGRVASRQHPASELLNTFGGDRGLAVRLRLSRAGTAHHEDAVGRDLTAKGARSRRDGRCGHFTASRVLE